MVNFSFITWCHPLAGGLPVWSIELGILATAIFDPDPNYLRSTSDFNRPSIPQPATQGSGIQHLSSALVRSYGIYRVAD